MICNECKKESTDEPHDCDCGAEGICGDCWIDNHDGCGRWFQWNAGSTRDWISSLKPYQLN